MAQTVLSEKECAKKYLKRGMHALFGQNEWPKIGYQIGKLIALHSRGWLEASLALHFLSWSWQYGRNEGVTIAKTEAV
ncbi:Hypothetical predicted protein [Cloeon dipterum]|uniref:Uncharacterized protein n=1 Tax=Cloeon dipterum TaxID=197152 RepID=A0A8S1DJ00_9INSE|nr:Hypothetical predicted protein [Cloeon dipterum]